MRAGDVVMFDVGSMELRRYYCFLVELLRVCDFLWLQGMEFQRSNNFDDGQGIPEDLRCKRSDGKQWRCSALSMPDKTVCEKHYIQAKKRAANSAMRASLKKARRKSLDDADMYSDTKDDDIDLPFGASRGAEFSSPAPSKKQASKSQHFYSPDDIDVNCLGSYNSEKLVNDFQGDGAYDDENRPKSTHRTLTSGINYAQRSSNGVALGVISKFDNMIFISMFFWKLVMRRDHVPSRIYRVGVASLLRDLVGEFAISAG